MEFTKETIIYAVLAYSPELAQLFIEKGVHCVGCPVAQNETIEQGLKAHGFSENEIESFIRELNRKKT